jgi:prolyl-tRNA synthetase
MRSALQVTRETDFSEWYQQVIKAAGLAEAAAVRGCMNIKPWGYAIWENIQQRFDRELKATGHRNAYFPLLIPLRFFQKEAQHVEGFAKECAVVTHHRLTSVDGRLLPDPAAELEEPLVIRPTSETIIGDAFSRWVQSYKDLPILINQWCNVMRWEMRTRLFLRTSEFLWQEGHTAHASRLEAIEEARLVLELYRAFATDVLCLPVIVGEKSAGERFPGAVSTWSIEAMMQDGKALQAGTSHFLGQNFSRAYDIKFSGASGVEYAWTTSWGISTRLIGGLIMTHSDDNGLVLPPAIAPAHIRVLLLSDEPDETSSLREYGKSLLDGAASRVLVRGEPLRCEYVIAGRRPGDAFWEAVKQGVPIIVQIGRKELEQGVISFTERTDPELKRHSMVKGEFVARLAQTLEDMQRSLLQRAIRLRDSNIRELGSADDIGRLLTEKEIPPFLLCPLDLAAEDTQPVQKILSEHQLSIRCLPEGDFQKQLSPNARCALTGGNASHMALLAKSY